VGVLAVPNIPVPNGPVTVGQTYAASERFLNGSDEAQWFASWQDGDRIADSPMGSREEAVAWAREMPADRRAVFSEDDDDYVDLP